MKTSYGNLFTVTFKDPVGNGIEIIDDFISLDYVWTDANIGQIVMTMPIKYAPYIYEECLAEVWRGVGGNIKTILDMDTTWLITYAKVGHDASGQLIFEVRGVDGKWVLNSRYVAQYAGTALAQFTSNIAAGNAMKSIVRNNVAAGANDYTGTANVANGALPARGIPAKYVTVQADTDDGAQIQMAFAQRNVLSVLQDIKAASIAAGLFLTFDMITTGSTLYEFRTFSGQRGTDRTQNDMRRINIDPAYNNLSSASFTYDITNEPTFAYALGSDQSTARQLAVSYVTAKINRGPFGRVEYIQDARQASDIGAVQLAANAALISKAAKYVFDGVVLESNTTRYGVDYGPGDFLPVKFLQRSANCRLDKVHINVANHTEKTDVRLQSS